MGQSDGGHKTTAIRRPSDPTRARARSNERDVTRFGDFTRPIQREKQLIKGRKRGVVWLVGLVTGAALIAALFVLPVQAYRRQQTDIERAQQRLEVLRQANAQMTAEINRLRTPEGIREAARTEIGYVDDGEIRISIGQQPDAPLTLPGGFPYDAVAQIIAVRANSQVVVPTE